MFAEVINQVKKIFTKTSTHQDRAVEIPFSDHEVAA